MSFSVFQCVERLGIDAAITKKEVEMVWTKERTKNGGVNKKFMDYEVEGVTSRGRPTKT